MARKVKPSVEKSVAVTSPSHFLFYQADDGHTRIEVRLEDETVWVTQAALSALYQTTPQNITMHIRNIFNSGEHSETATCKEYLQVRQEGTRNFKRLLTFYNLDMILAVGYRVNSHRGTQFRQWAVIDELNLALAS